MPADLFTLFRYLFIFLRGVALRVAFMEHRGGALVAFTAFVAFMRRLGWSPFVAFSVCNVYGALGWDPCGVYSVCIVYGGWGWTSVAFTAFLAFIRRSGWSFWWRFRVLVVFMGDWGGTRLAFMGHWR